MLQCEMLSTLIRACTAGRMTRYVIRPGFEGRKLLREWRGSHFDGIKQDPLVDERKGEASGDTAQMLDEKDMLVSVNTDNYRRLAGDTLTGKQLKFTFVVRLIGATNANSRDDI